MLDTQDFTLADFEKFEKTLHKNAVQKRVQGKLRKKVPPEIQRQRVKKNWNYNEYYQCCDHCGKHAGTRKHASPCHIPSCSIGRTKVIE